MGLFRVKIVGGLVAAILGLAAPAYACLCCPWTAASDATGCSASSPNSVTSECRYNALTSGDIAGRGAWQVNIDRGGHRITYEGPYASPFTVVRGAIEPGDAVTVVAEYPGAVSAGPLAEQNCP